MASLTSLQKRYKRSLDNEDYYGAEQACRMMHHRLTQSKTASKDDIEKALDVITTGSITMLEKGQIQEGAALALMVTKHYVDFKVVVTDATVSTLESLSKAFETVPDLSAEGCRERLRFFKAAVAWSMRRDVGGFTNGHVDLNKLAAHAAGSAGDYSLAQRYFIHSNDPDRAASVLYRYAQEQTLPSEKSLVLTRLVLLYLVSENIHDAFLVRRSYAQLARWRSVCDTADKNAAVIADDVPPLANFCELLIKICQLETAAAPLFKRLCDGYKVALSRDPSFSQQLTKIGQMYFSIQPPQPAGLSGMMGTMLRGMMNNQ